MDTYIFPRDIIAESNTLNFMQVSCVPLYVASKPLRFAFPNDVIPFECCHFCYTVGTCDSAQRR